MFKNFILTALRNFGKNKVITFLNITGLAIGIACAMMIFMWIRDEINYDSSHQLKDQIFRVLVNEKGKDEIYAQTPGLLAEKIKSEVPEIKYAARVMQNHRNPYKYEDKAFYEDKSYCVDPDFFKIFTFPVIKGNTINPVEGPNDIVISKQIAEKYFEDENPIGKKLRWNNWADYNVSGVIDNMSSNSSLQFEIIESHQLSKRFWKGGYNWTNYVHETYILVESNSVLEHVEKKVETVLNENSHIASRYYNVKLQPLDDIHLNADILSSSVITNDRVYISIFSMIAIGILLIACFNFINISTANSSTRAKEVGIRKVIGAQRSNLVYQFLVEFSLLALLASLMSFFIVDFTLPYLNQFTNKNLSLDLNYILISLLIILFTVFAAGIYPAFYLSMFSASKTEKKDQSNRNNRIQVRSILVVTQFAISILLIVSTLLLSSQLTYIQSKKLGFEKENILYLPAKDKFAESYESTKSRLLQNSEIVSTTMQQCVPTMTIEGSWVHWENQTKEDLVVRNTKVTLDYFETMNIPLEEGRYFSEKYPTDKEFAFILNRAAVKYLELETPVGKEIRTAGRSGKIIGVVANSNFKSLHHQVEPLIFMPLNKYSSINLFGVVLIKFSSNDVQSLLEKIRSVWSEYNPNIPFEYHFLDQHIEKQYGFEKQLKYIFEWFSVLAILISMIGLLGLSILLLNQRTKEVGIRKVLGASVFEITALLTKNFMKWIIIANIISWPVAYYFMDKWLQNYAYRVDIGLWIFILAGSITLMIALSTVSFQAIKAAIANPVDSLRSE